MPLLIDKISNLKLDSSESERKRLETLFKSQGFSSIISICVGVTLGIIFYTKAPLIISIFLGIVVFFGALRFLYTKRSLKKLSTLEKPKLISTENIYGLIVLCHMSAWAFISISMERLFPNTPDSFIVTITAIALVVVGMSNSSSSLKVSLSFVFGSILPFSIFQFFQISEKGLLLPITCSFFMIFLYKMIKNSYEQTIDLISANEENEKLITSLGQKENQLTLLYENSPFGFAFCDMEGNLIDVNKKYEEITGYKIEELKTLSYWDITPKKYEAEEQKQIDQMIRTGSYGPYRKEYKTKSGDLIPVELNGFVVKNFDGQDGIWSIIEDISDEVKSKKELSLILEGNQTGIWKLDLTNNTLEWDKGMHELYQVTPDEFSGRYEDWEKHLHPDYKNQAISEFKEALKQKGRFEFTFKITTSQGNMRFIQSRALIERDSDHNPVMVIGVNTDITEFKLAQDNQLQEINEIISSTPSCLKIINSKGQLLEMNGQGLELIEADSFESVELADVYSLVTEEHREKFKAFNQRICSGEKGTLTFEIIGLKGTRRWMETYAAPYKLINGEIAHIAITNDISSRIETEENYAKQKALASHQSKLASIGELAAGVGHEINNPLAIIQGYLSVIEKKIELNNIQFEEFTNYIQKINVATERIVRIVSGLRNFSRTDSLESTLFSPLEAVSETYDMMREIYQNDGIDFEFEHEEIKAYGIYGNRGEFQQVIMNLLTNARDAVESSFKKEVNILLSVEDDKLLLEISDSGEGIPDSVREKIFDPFFTTKDVNKGTGIGLSLAHNFVKEMDGEIHFESQYKQGTKFKITLPTSPLANSQEQKETIPSRSSFQFNLRAIVADDEQEIREILCEMLSEIGITSTQVCNGKEALELYRNKPEDFDLLITDMKMPKMDGPSLIKYIRTDKHLNQPKIIAITGGINVDFEDTNNELIELIDGHLLKPFSEDDLVKILQGSFKKKPEQVA